MTSSSTSIQISLKIKDQRENKKRSKLGKQKRTKLKQKNDKIKQIRKTA